MPQAPSPQGSSLTVLGGPLDGTTYSLGTSFEELLVGSDPGCHVHIDLPGVSPLHANLLVEAAGVTVRDTRSPFGLYVNDDPVSGPTRLRDSDILWLGQPGEPSSVMLLCKVVVLATPVTVPVGSTPDDADGFFVEADMAPAAPEPVEEFVLEAEPAPAAVEPPVPAPADDDVFFIEEERPAASPAPAARPMAPAPPPPAPAREEEAAFVVDFVESSAPPAPATHDTFVLDLPGDTPAQGVVPVRGADPALEFFVDEPAAPAPAPPPAAAPIVVPRPRAGAAPATAGRTAPVRPAAAPPVTTAARPPAEPAAAPAPARPAAPAPAARLTAPAPPTPARPMAPPVARPAAPESARPRPARTAPPTPAPRPARGGSGGKGLRLALIAGAVLLLLAAGGGFAAWTWSRTPRLDGVTPPRAHPGQVVQLRGARFAPEARALFGGQPARVVKRAPEVLEVEVPELPLTAGADRPVTVVVQNGERASAAVTLQGFVAPRLHGIAPDVALPGEEVELAGTGFGADAQVRFGSLPAEVLRRTAETLRVRVPALGETSGTKAPVTVVQQGATSNPAPFFVGRLPLVLDVQPARAAAGDVLELTGRGFRAEPGATQVRLGGVPALVVEARDAALRVVVPWGVPGGPAAVEVQVAGLEPLGQSTVEAATPAPVVDLHFVAEPLPEAPDGALAALATEWGPAFVVAASGGKSAAQRAFEAQGKLNQAAVAIKASLSAEFEARFTDPPTLGLRGKPEALLEATPDDAAAYARSGGKAVSPARLMAWWHAVARDLVLLLARSERPQHAAALAGEGRTLAEAFQAARRAAPFGVPRHVTESKGLRAALRGLALRVPAGVPEPALAAGATTAAASVAPLRLDGNWSGHESVPEGRRSIAVSFQARGGTFTLEGGLGLSVPLMSVERQRSEGVVFSLRMAGGVRYYRGRWDGERLRGDVSTDAAGRESVGRFELAPR
jgi:hypothetical protein